jgi:hypothetical protein
MNVKTITLTDLLTVKDKSDLIIEMVEKNIDFNKLSYKEQEKIILEFLERKKRERI